MAAGTSQKFSELVIDVGDGEDPEVFTLLCGLTSKSFGIQNEMATTIVPDCADEDAPAFMDAAPVSQSMPLSGSGVFVAENRDNLLKWAEDATTKNIRVYPGTGSVAGEVSYYSGPAYLSEFTITGERGPRLQAAVAFTWATKPTRTVVAA